MLAWGFDDVEGSVDVGPFRDAYLKPFARVTNVVELDVVAATAMRLGWVCRAINTHSGDSDEEKIHVLLRMFLDGRP